jgi:hypothetical protein
MHPVEDDLILLVDVRSFKEFNVPKLDHMSVKCAPKSFNEKIFVAFK